MFNPYVRLLPKRVEPKGSLIFYKFIFTTLIYNVVRIYINLLLLHLFNY